MFKSILYAAFNVIVFGCFPSIVPFDEGKPKETDIQTHIKSVVNFIKDIFKRNHIEA